MKYFKILSKLVAFSLKSHLENRFNTFASMFSSVLLLIISLIFVEVYFSFSKEILGWTKAEVFFVAGMYRVVTAAFIVLFQRSINYLSRDIQMGNLDFYLTKPISSQFFLSFKHIRIQDSIGVISGLVVMIYATTQLHLPIGAGSWLFLFLNLISAIAILYGIMFFSASFTVWMGRFNALFDVLIIIRSLIERPIDFLGPRVGFVLTYFLPLAFMVTIPSEIFFSKISLSFTVVSIVVALTCIWLSHAFWKYSLKHYTSASS